MRGLLEVIALHADDAKRAEEGGANRIELVGTMDDDGLSPEPALVEKVRAATTLELRPMVRLRDGFGTDGGEFVRLRGLIASYIDSGADGVVFGFLNGLSEVDVEVCSALCADAEWPWTFHRAVDHALNYDHAWRDLLTLPRLDAVLTAGSSRGVEAGLDELLRLAAKDERIPPLLMAGGGLAPDHVPWLIRAGVRQFHVGSRVRPDRSWRSYVDAPLVHTWRSLIDDAVRHAEQSLPPAG